jgi:beta-N-acetylhexosaminidase
MTLGPLMVDLKGITVAPEERELLRHPLVGGVVLFARNYADPEQLTALVATLHALRTPRLIVGVDQEGGRVQSFVQGFSRLPPMRRIGQEYDLNPRAGLRMARNLGWLMAAELRAHGVDLSFAPCVDLDYGVGETIGDRSFHRRPDAVGQLAVAYVHGMRDAGMAATAKHFPGQGAVVADPQQTLPVDRRELPDLMDDMTPYRALIANGLPSARVAHVLFPSVDSVPASLSGHWIRDVLRGEMQFQGVVFADDLSMAGAAATQRDLVGRARQALSAGCDMLPVCNDRPGVEAVLRRLDLDPEPASQLRLVRLHGRDSKTREQLKRAPEWTISQEMLARCAAAPALNLEAGQT